MDLLSKKNTGGNIATNGFSFQRLVAIIYLFKYFSEEEFKSISFESNNDFTIHFQKECGISFQVKVENCGISILKEQLDLRNDKNYEQVLIVSGLTNELRKLFDKREKLLNIESGNFTKEEKEKTKNAFKKMCSNKNIDYKKLLDFRVEVISHFKTKDFALAEISKWSNSNNMLIDDFLVLNDIYTIISSEKEPVGGSLVKNDINKIVKRYIKRESTILSSVDHAYGLDNLLLNELKNLVTRASQYNGVPRMLLESFEKSDWTIYFEKLESLQQSEDSLKGLFIISASYFGKYKKAIDVYENIETKKTDRVKLAAAFSYIELENFKEAYEILTTTFNTEVINDFPVQYFLGKCEVKLKDFETGKQKIEESLNQYGDKLDSIIYRDMFKLIPHPRNENDLNLLELSIRKDPDQYEAFFEKGKFFMDIEDFSKSLYYLKEASKREQSLFENLEYLILLTIANLKLKNKNTVNILSKMCRHLIKNNKEFNIDSHILLWYEGYNFSTKILINRTSVNGFKVKIDDNEEFNILESCDDVFAIGSCVNENNLMFYALGEINEMNEDFTEEKLIKMMNRIKTDIYYQNKYSSPLLLMKYKSDENLEFFLKTLEEEKVIGLNKIKQVESKEIREYICMDKETGLISIYDNGIELEVIITFGSARFSGFISKQGEGFVNFKRLLNNKNMFSEAMFVLISSEKQASIIIDKDQIEIKMYM